MSPTMNHATAPLAVVPASRARALFRSILWLAPALIFGAATKVVFTNLWLSEVGFRNRLVDYSLTLVALPLPILTLLLVWTGGRWLLLSLWPGEIGFFAFPNALVGWLGPFGHRSYDRGRLKIQYFFELDEDDEAAGGFEAYLPEEEQMAKYLPRMKHPQALQPIHEMMLRFAGGTEAEVAAKLRPAVEAWRNQPDARAPGS